MAERTLFLLSEEVKKVNKDVETLIFNIHHPLAGKHARTLELFTRALVKAHAKNIGMTFEHSEQFAPRKKTRRIMIPKIVQRPIAQPIRPAQQAQPIQQPVPIEKPLHSSIANDGLAIPLPLPPTVPIVQQVQEKRISLITSHETGAEMAYAKEKGVVYTVHELLLSDDETKILNALRKIVVKKKELLMKKKKLLSLAKKAAKQHKLKGLQVDINKLRYYLVKHIINFGLIDPLLYDPDVCKIICDGPRLHIRVVRGVKELVTNLIYNNEGQLQDFLEKVAERSGQNLSPTNPAIEAEIENFKVKATLGTSGIASRFVMERML